MTYVLPQGVYGNNQNNLYIYAKDKCFSCSNKIDKIVLPSDKKITNDVLENHCKKFVKTNYHPSGTAKMGADNDNESVLDAKMIGELTIKGKSQKIPIDIEVIKLASELVQIKSEISFSRNEFDIGTGSWKNTTILKDEIKIKANIFLFKE